MGAGLHGLNGVNPKVAIHLIQIYVMPRLFYGLEITSLRQNEMQKLESYLKKLLKQVQNLPETTSNEATYLVMGRMPVIGELAIHVWTSSLRLLPVEILSIPR
jgi:hypothetical protein